MTRSPFRSRDLVPALQVPGAIIQEKALGALTGLLEDIAACRAEIVRKEAAAQELEKRLRTDLSALEARWVDLRVQTFRALGRHLRDGRLNRKAHKTLARAASALADELETEYGADLAVDRRVYLGQDEDEPAEEVAFYSGRKPRRAAPADESGAGEGRSRPRDPGPDAEEHGSLPGSKAADKRAAKDQALAGDIRALYLILARALHPDKEANPSLREAKTVWMQKVTTAYARKDLAMLLDILARNPLEAVGPYLADAPLKTVQGFTKRLRRELATLREQAGRVGEWLHPSFARFLKEGAIDEAGLARHLGELKRAVRLAKQRLDAYRTPEGVLHLIDGLRTHAWGDLL